MIELQTLGPVAVRIAGEPAPARLLWRKHLALLVYLALSPRRTRSRDHLIGLLWADKGESAARHSLNEAVRVLRRAAGDAALDTSNGQLRLGAIECDVERFDALAGAALWAEAAALVQGEFLEGFSVPGASPFEDWLAAERAGRRRGAVEALAEAAGAALAAGGAGESAALAHRAILLDPLSEVAARAAMRAAAVAGDRAMALEHFQRLTRDLALALGADPDARTVALAQRIRSERAQPATPEPSGVPSRRAPLVGRREALSQLLARWHAARTGSRAALLVIDGESGTGKSRLADEVATRARLDGAAVAAVRAVEGDAADPWNGLFALARGGLLHASGVAAAAPSALAAFAAALPDWGDRFPAARSLEPDSPPRAFRAALRAAAEAQPVLVFVDDAQWLDRDSLLALFAVLRDLAALPVALLLTVAPRPPSAVIDDARARVGRELEGCTVRLESLSEAEIRELVHWAIPSLDGAAQARLARRVLADSAGLPLLAFELLHAVTLGLELDPSASWPSPFRTLDSTLPGDLPDAVVSAIRVGFHRLDPAARSVLCAAAVLGGRVTGNDLAAAAGLPPSDAPAALDALEWDRWLDADARGYAFAARIVSQVIARDMVTAGQRRRIEASRVRT